MVILAVVVKIFTLSTCKLGEALALGMHTLLKFAGSSSLLGDARMHD
jgi:hypothetical protein